MDLKLDRIIGQNQINKFIVLNFILFFLSYILSKGFLQNEELSDKIFLILCVISIEISYLFFSNKLIDDKTKRITDSLFLLISFIFIYFIWNLEIIRSYVDTTFFLLFHLILVLPILILLKNRIFLKSNNLDVQNLVLIIFLSFGFSGIFFQISYVTLGGFFVLLAFQFYLEHHHQQQHSHLNDLNLIELSFHN